MADETDRRAFLRGIMGRAARAASDHAPELLAALGAEARADAVGTTGAAPFAVPDDQRDLAEALAARGWWVARGGDAWAVAGAGARRPLGPAAAAWERGVREGQRFERTRPRDAILLQQARAELAAPPG